MSRKRIGLDSPTKNQPEPEGDEDAARDGEGGEELVVADDEYCDDDRHWDDDEA